MARDRECCRKTGHVEHEREENGKNIGLAKRKYSRGDFSPREGSGMGERRGEGRGEGEEKKQSRFLVKKRNHSGFRGNGESKNPKPTGDAR
jgi:hypothetical protein